MSAPSAVRLISSTAGVILSAAYMLWMVQRVFFGPLANPENMGLKDLNLRELLTALPFVVLVIVMGLRPQPILDVLEPSSTRYVARALWASDEEHANPALVKVRVRPLPEGGSAPTLQAPTMVAPAQVLGAPTIPSMPMLRAVPPRVLQAGPHP